MCSSVHFCTFQPVFFCGNNTMPRILSSETSLNASANLYRKEKKLKRVKLQVKAARLIDHLLLFQRPVSAEGIRPRLRENASSSRNRRDRLQAFLRRRRRSPSASPRVDVAVGVDGRGKRLSEAASSAAAAADDGDDERRPEPTREDFESGYRLRAQRRSLVAFRQMKCDPSSID